MSRSMPAKSGFALLVALTLISPATAALANGDAALEGYRIRFEANHLEGKDADSDDAPRSTIRIVRAIDDATVYLERSPLIPGCGRVPAVATLGRGRVALCGHLGGRHYTYRVFRAGQSGPEGTSLDTFDQAEPLSIDDAGRVTTLVGRRDQFPGELVGPLYFPYVYALHEDPSSFGFVPTFDLSAKSRYLDFYAWMKANQDPAQFLPVMLAALIATQDRASICREIKAWRKGGLQKRHDMKSVDGAIRYWSARLPEIGYPKFNLNAC